MTKTICDRCGREISRRYTDNGYYVVSVSINPTCQSNRTNVDLCEDCNGLLNNLVHEFIRGKERVIIEPLTRPEWLLTLNGKFIFPDEKV